MARMSLARLAPVAIAAAALLLAGCAYTETSAKLARGGYYDTRLTTAQRNYENEQDRKTQLERDQQRLADERASIERDTQRYDQQLAALNAELKQSNADLERARNTNKVSRAQYDKLKADLDQLRLEEQAQSFSRADPGEKQRKLEELRSRKEALQTAIKALAAG